MEKLTNNFKMKEIGVAKGCIGIRINQSDGEIQLDQETYTREIIKRFGMEDAIRTVHT